MSKKIAVCGKGGVGKTTVVCGIINYLLNKNKTPVLVVDADPNSNLAENLGINYTKTISDVREKLRYAEIPKNISKYEYFNLEIQNAIVENSGFDLLVMGRPEGKECYCFINELLRTFLSNLNKTYKYVVIDTEAGMEHFSRRTTDNLDLLIIVSIPTKISFDTVKRILDMIKKIDLKIMDTKILLNQMENEINTNNFYFDAIIKKDKMIFDYSEKGLNLLKNIENTNFYKELEKFLVNINL